MTTAKKEREPVAPVWYQVDEVLEAIKNHSEEWGWVPPERAAFIARHLQLASARGFKYAVPWKGQVTMDRAIAWLKRTLCDWFGCHYFEADFETSGGPIDPPCRRCGVRDVWAFYAQCIRREIKAGRMKSVWDS